MFFWISVAMAMTITLPALAGLFRYSQLHRYDRLFVLVTWLGCINELLSVSLILLRGTNATSFNYYVLAESFLYLLLFRKWNIIESKTVFTFLLSSVLATWLTDNLYLQNLGNFYGIFNVYVALIIMFFSVKCIARQVTCTNRDILTDARFLVATGLLLNCCVNAITGSFFIIDLHISAELSRRILFIPSLVNVVSNLLYLSAIICFNRNRKFTLEYW
jgi:hypothetical protein